MALITAQIPIFHITQVSNLGGIVATGGLHSDAGLVNVPHDVIGYSHIKERRLTEYRIPCCGDRFVGEFVPFYYCPRSPMLYTINIGKTGRPPGSQSSIVHLVSSVGAAIGLGRIWAISDGNAGAGHTLFFNNLSQLDELDWDAIHARQWAGRTHQKSAEFLVEDFFPLTSIHEIACHNDGVRQEIEELLTQNAHRPGLVVRPDWYY